MALIRNCFNQRLIVNLTGGGKNIELLAKETARVSKKELLSPHLQSLASAGVIEEVQPQLKKTVKRVKKKIRQRRGSKNKN